MIIDIAFYILAFVTVGAAVSVVLTRDLFYAALFLILSFFTVAGLYVTLNADFMAAIQVLVYVGAIGVLILFAIMLTRNVHLGGLTNQLNLPALILAVFLLATIAGITLTTDWTALSEVVGGVQVPVGEPTTSHIAEALFSRDGGFVLPFEIAALLLLASIIGAMALARERK